MRSRTRRQTRKQAAEWASKAVDAVMSSGRHWDEEESDEDNEAFEEELIRIRNLLGRWGGIEWVEALKKESAG